MVNDLSIKHLKLNTTTYKDYPDRETRLEFKEPESGFCEKKSRRHEIFIAIITQTCVQRAAY